MSKIRTRANEQARFRRYNAEVISAEPIEKEETVEEVNTVEYADEANEKDEIEESEELEEDEEDEEDEDDDDDDEELMECLEFIGALIEEYNKGVHVPVPEQQAIYNDCCRMMIDCVDGVETSISFKKNHNFKGMASIHAAGRKVIITNPRIFTTIGKFATNFEAAPKLDGTVDMDFTFHHLTRKVNK